MPEQDDRLSAELREYYQGLGERPAPDVTARVMSATDARAAWVRRWGAAGGGLVAVAAVAGVVVVTLANHNAPSGVGPAHSTAPTAAATNTPARTVAASPTPAQAIPLGPAVHGFVPADVTAVSAAEWWVLGSNGVCPAGTCTRILHTTDGGQTFASLPVPDVAAAANGQQADRLRFADPLDGWLVGPTGTVWETHDGAAHWTQDGGTAAVADLEASGGDVYAISCAGGSSCAVERSATGADAWTLLPASLGHGMLSGLNVNGGHVWAAIASPGGGPGSLIASADSGAHFTTETVCPSALGYARADAVSGSVLWAICATGTEAQTFESVDAGQHFTQVTAQLMLPNFASIAGVSSNTAVAAGQGLLRTTDGGRSFTSVQSSQAQWTVVGFTTSADGFAFRTSGAVQLWRTDDAGAQWHEVTFP